MHTVVHYPVLNVDVIFLQVSKCLQVNLHILAKFIHNFMFNVNSLLMLLGLIK